jgi:hypothetical protein
MTTPHEPWTPHCQRRIKSNPYIKVLIPSVERANAHRRGACVVDPVLPDCASRMRQERLSRQLRRRPQRLRRCTTRNKRSNKASRVNIYHQDYLIVFRLTHLEHWAVCPKNSR